jgi:hypothetical protein
MHCEDGSWDAFHCSHISFNRIACAVGTVSSNNDGLLFNVLHACAPCFSFYHVGVVLSDLNNIRLA